MVSPAAMMVSGDEALPDELWEEIFAYLDGDYFGYRLESVSLVCKRFLALSNRARTTFFLPAYDCPFPVAIFSRFRHARTVRLRYGGDSIAHLARSGLPIRAFHLTHRFVHFPRDDLCLLGRRMSATLRSLSCFRCLTITDDDLAAVADSFPYLEQLDLTDSPVSDRGIMAVSLKLKSLISINLSSQDRYLTPLSLRYLSSNCPSISDLSAKLSTPVSLVDHILPFASLTSLHLVDAEISEAALRRASTADLKLWKLILVSPQISGDITGATLCRFFKSCRYLRHLQLSNFEFPSDLSALDFAASIPNIEFISSLGCGSKLPEGTLFHLLSGCNRLQDIAMSCDRLGTLSGLPVRYQVRRLRLSGCCDLSDDALAVMGSIFPSIESLRFLACSAITTAGIEVINTKCRILKHFDVEKCSSLEHFDLNFSLTNQIEEPWLVGAWMLLESCLLECRYSTM